MGLNTIMSPRFGAVASYTIRFTSVTSPLLRMGLMESPTTATLCPKYHTKTKANRQTIAILPVHTATGFSISILS